MNGGCVSPSPTRVDSEGRNDAESDRNRRFADRIEEGSGPDTQNWPAEAAFSIIHPAGRNSDLFRATHIMGNHEASASICQACSREIRHHLSYDYLEISLIHLGDCALMLSHDSAGGHCSEVIACGPSAPAIQT